MKLIALKTKNKIKLSVIFSRSIEIDISGQK